MDRDSANFAYYFYSNLLSFTETSNNGEGQFNTGSSSTFKVKNLHIASLARSKMYLTVSMIYMPKVKKHDDGFHLDSPFLGEIKIAVSYVIKINGSILREGTPPTEENEKPSRVCFRCNVSLHRRLD